MSRMMLVGIRHIHQPLKSTSTRRCIHGVVRRLLALKSWASKVAWFGPQKKRHSLMFSPKVWSTERSYRLNMCPPTMVGLRVKSANWTARRTPSVSTMTSSSSSRQ